MKVSLGSTDTVAVYSNKIMCGWDFCISKGKAAKVKKRNIFTDLKVCNFFSAVCVTMCSRWVTIMGNDMQRVDVNLEQTQLKLNFTWKISVESFLSIVVMV